MISPIQIGPLKIEAPILLAPMAGVTDLPFRRQAAVFGAPYVVSEMVASEELARERPDMVRRAAGAGMVRPLVIQLAGRTPAWMERGAALAEAAGADVIDINMGCPAKSVTCGASGSALMREPALAQSLIAATVSGTSRPVTLKMRLGWDHGSLNAPEIAQRAEEAGVKMIVVHGRTRQQFYRDHADWAAIAATVKAVSIPVIANGDIVDIASARQALAQSGAAGLMVGRAAQGKPWFPKALADALKSGAGQIAEPAWDKAAASLFALLDDSLELYGPRLGLKTARKHIAWAVDALRPDFSPESRKGWRTRLLTQDDPAALADDLAAFFDRPPARHAA